MPSKCATRAAALLSVLLLLVVRVAANDVENEGAYQEEPISPTAPATSAEAGEDDYSCTTEECIRREQEAQSLAKARDYSKFLRIEVRALTSASQVARWAFVEQPSRDTWQRFVRTDENRTEAWRKATDEFYDIIWTELDDLFSKNDSMKRFFWVLNENLFYESASFHLGGAGAQEQLDRLRAFLLHRFGIADSVLNLSHVEHLVRQVATLAPINFTTVAKANADRRTSLYLHKRALFAWLHWCDSVGPLLKPAFTQLVHTLNDKTRLITHYFGNNLVSNVSNFWLHQLRTLDPHNFPRVDWIDALWRALEPLYVELHAFVRTRALERERPFAPLLPASYFAGWTPDGYVGAGGDEWTQHKWVAAGLLPEHVLGSVWADDWSAFAELDAPATEHEDNQSALLQRATALFQTFGFELPERSIHWTLNSTACLPTAWNMFADYSSNSTDENETMFTDYSSNNTNKNETLVPDLRLRLCPEVMDARWYERLVYAMSELHYMRLASGHQFPLAKPLMPAFSIAIGGLFRVMATAPTYHLHYIRSETEPSLWTIDQLTLSNPAFERSRIHYLLRVALEMLPRMAFSHTLEKWRAEVFSYDTSPEQYNAKWWQLECEIRGLFPPSARPLDGFDVGATYEVASSEFVLPACLGRVLQFQLLAQLCSEGGFDGPLDLCDLRHTALAGRAGDRLRLVMRLGASEKWSLAETLKKSNLSSLTDFNPRPLLAFFEPLRKWLRSQLDNAKFVTDTSTTGLEDDDKWYIGGWDRSMCAQAVYGRPLRSSTTSAFTIEPGRVVLIFQGAILCSLYRAMLDWNLMVL